MFLVGGVLNLVILILVLVYRQLLPFIVVAIALPKVFLDAFPIDKVAMDKKGKECHDESKANEYIPDLV